jgi:acyl transferase domain-containing protein
MLPLDPAALVGVGAGPPERAAPTASAQQIATFVLEYGVARHLRALGLPIDAMFGYSVGEYVAACLAGVFGLESALAAMAAEATAADALPPGAMIAVPLSERDCTELLRQGVWLAAVEAPALCVLSGLPDPIADVEAELRRRHVAVLRLPAEHPFHTPLAQGIRPQARQALEREGLRPPAIPVVSCVTGTWLTAGEAVSATYWATRRGRAIRFADGMRTLAREPRRFYVDVSDGGTLIPLVLANFGGQPDLASRAVAVVRRTAGGPTPLPLEEVVAAWRSAGPV